VISRYPSVQSDPEEEEGEKEQQPLETKTAEKFHFYERDSSGDVHHRYEFFLRICSALVDSPIEKIHSVVWIVQRVFIHDVMGIGRPNPGRGKLSEAISPSTLRRGNNYKQLLQQHRSKIRQQDKAAELIDKDSASLQQKGRKLCRKCGRPYKKNHVCS